MEEKVKVRSHKRRREFRKIKRKKVKERDGKKEKWVFMVEKEDN